MRVPQDQVQVHLPHPRQGRGQAARHHRGAGLDRAGVEGGVAPADEEVPAEIQKVLPGGVSQLWTPAANIYMEVAGREQGNLCD